MTPEPVLVISLHGIGASGAQLMPLAGGWRGGLSTARVAAPDGPVHSSYGGHRWFGVDGSELRPDRINAIRQAFDDVIHKIVQREGFAEHLDRVDGRGLAGRYHGSRRRGIRSMAGQSSGLLFRSPASVPITAAHTRTAIFLVHGQDDRTIPAAASTLAASQLRAAGFAAHAEVLPGVGHTISTGVAQLALEFLERAFE